MNNGQINESNSLFIMVADHLSVMPVATDNKVSVAQHAVNYRSCRVVIVDKDTLRVVRVRITDELVNVSDVIERLRHAIEAPKSVGTVQPF